MQTCEVKYGKYKDLVIISIEDSDSPLTASSLESILNSLIEQLKKEPDFNGNAESSGDNFSLETKCGAV